MRVTFKKGKPYCGMMRLAPTYEANLNGQNVATIQQHKDEGWFWYGDGKNTCNTLKSLDLCKQEIREHFYKKHTNTP